MFCLSGSAYNNQQFSKNKSVNEIVKDYSFPIDSVLLGIPTRIAVDISVLKEIKVIWWQPACVNERVFNEIYEIKIFFAGDGIITINSEVIEVTMQDHNKSWHVKHVPMHKIRMYNFVIILNRT